MTNISVDSPKTRGGERTEFASAAFHRAQLRHFILFDVVPAIGTVIAVATLPWLPLNGLQLALFFGFWLITGLGLTVGYHRYFSHRAFTAPPFIAHMLLVFGAMSARGPMVSWAAMHRRHHERSDRDGDLHSPNLHGTTIRGRLRGLLHAQLTWMIRHNYPNVAHYVPDLLKDKGLMRWNRRYYLCVAVGLLLPALIAGVLTASWQGVLTGFLWAGVVRIFVVEQTMSAINSVCHLIGTKRFGRDDNSRNLSWAGLLTWGESHHNNHHALSNSAAFGLHWYEFDPGFWFIRALERLGLVSNVRRPHRDTAAIGAKVEA